MSNIDDIVNVQISIESPTSTGESFSALLLVAPTPENAGSITMPDVAEISYATDLSDYGYTEESETYLAATVAFAQDPRPEKVYVVARKSDSGTTEAIATTLERAAATTGWYGIALVGDATGSDIKAVAQWAEANEKLFGFGWTGSETPIDVTAYNRTFAMYYNSTETADKYGALALMAKCFGYDPGSESWDLKTLGSVGVTSLTNAKIKELEKVPSMYYTKIANKNCTMNGKVGSGEWIDIIRFRDWLVSEIQSKVFNYLTSNQKVPYTDDGITGVQGQVEAVLKSAQSNGAVEADTTDSTGTKTAGYTVTVPSAADISSADKKTRKLRNVKFTARLTGAINATTIKGTLMY